MITEIRGQCASLENEKKQLQIRKKTEKQKKKLYKRKRIASVLLKGMYGKYILSIDIVQVIFFFYFQCVCILLFFRSELKLYTLSCRDREISFVPGAVQLRSRRRCI